MNLDFHNYRFKINDIPQKYHDQLSLSVYLMCTYSDQKDSTVGIMQLVKHVFKDRTLKVSNDTTLKVSFPDEVVYKILHYAIKYCLIGRQTFHSVNFEELKQSRLKSVLQPPILDFSIKPYYCRSIRQSAFMLGFRKYLLPDDYALKEAVYAFCISAVDVKDITEDFIVGLKKSGLIYFDGKLIFKNEDNFNQEFIFSDQKRIVDQNDHEIYTFSMNNQDQHAYFSYLFYKTFNAHPEISLIFDNRYSDINCNGVITSEGKKKCFVKLFDRNINAECGLFEFDDYIKNCFCSGKLLFVELVEQKIQANGCSRLFKERLNHRIEIYDIETHEKIFVLPLALSGKKIGDKKIEAFLYALVYIDDQYLYLQKIQDKKVFSVNYYSKISDCSLENFFYSEDKQKLIQKNKTSEELPEKTVSHKKSYLQSFLYFVKGRLAKFLEHIFNVCFSLHEKELEIILKLIVKD